MKIFEKVDKTVFFTAGILYLAIFLYIFIAPTQAAENISAVVNVTLNSFGFVYILIYASVLITFIAIGFSRYGKIKLGHDDDKPEFSFFSWMGMLFGAGLGVGIVFYGVSEPVSHFMYPPFAEAGTVEAANEAMRYTFFHWSFLPWCLYGMTGLCIGYFLHRRGLPCLVSSTFQPMLGDKIGKTQGKLIDSFSLIAIICGVSMSLGIACTQFTSGLDLHYGIPNSFGVVAVVIIVVGIIAILSAVSGVAKGIKYISDMNMYIIIALFIFMMIFGSQIHLLKVFFESMGSLVANFVDMMFFLDSNGAVEEKAGYNWVGSWTMLYWAWWVAFAPFVGGFLAKISKGRTIREFVIACTVVPSIMCCLWFAFFGGEAISMTLFEGSDICEVIMTNTDNSLFVLLGEMPMSGITIPVAMLLIITLILTSVNSATLVAGQFSVTGLEEPSLGVRAFWGVFIILNALAFIYIGGIQTLKSTALLLAFPFIIIVVFMVVNLLIALRKNEFQD